MKTMLNTESFLFNRNLKAGNNCLNCWTLLHKMINTEYTHTHQVMNTFTAIQNIVLTYLQPVCQNKLMKSYFITYLLMQLISNQAVGRFINQLKLIMSECTSAPEYLKNAKLFQNKERILTISVCCHKDMTHVILCFQVCLHVGR